MKSRSMISMSLLVAFCTSVGYLSAQENTSVLDAPPEWKSEIIPFPIGFAQDIPLKGIEELRFAPNWNNPESDEFGPTCSYGMLSPINQ
ncbi:MAG: hypothetical protein N4A46_14965 [Schleiferiaceae bacterium]|nr:hypothetical protein [Schleiferiaceae bacterium]